MAAPRTRDRQSGRLTRLQRIMGNDLTAMMFLWRACMDAERMPTKGEAGELLLRSGRVNRALRNYAREVAHA